MTSNNGTSYKTTSQDIAGFEAGDTIEVWAWLSATPQVCHVKNFRIYGAENLYIPIITW